MNSDTNLIEKNADELLVSKDYDSNDISIKPLRLAVPFEVFFKKKTPPDIYTGNELIPFEKRDPLFKSILRKEFSNALKEFYNTLKKHELI
jgi:hypothetical protein